MRPQRRVTALFYGQLERGNQREPLPWRQRPDRREGGSQWRWRMGGRGAGTANHPPFWSLCIECFLCVCMLVCAHVCACVHMCVCMCVCACICTCACSCVHVCIHVYMHICVRVCMHVHVCLYMCLCVSHMHSCAYSPTSPRLHSSAWPQDPPFSGATRLFLSQGST